MLYRVTWLRRWGTRMYTRLLEDTRASFTQDGLWLGNPGLFQLATITTIMVTVTSIEPVYQFEISIAFGIGINLLC